MNEFQQTIRKKESEEVAKDMRRKGEEKKVQWQKQICSCEEEEEGKKITNTIQLSSNN